jgi:tRNA(adenine34) deaminase
VSADDRRWQAGMQQALQAARQAASQGQVPIGAVLELDGVYCYSNANQSGHSDQPLAHAELLVLQAASQTLSQADFRRSILYVTLEPCPMCLGAMLHCHLGTLIFGAYNLKWGACGTVQDLTRAFPAEALQCWGGIAELACAGLLQDFFGQLRQTDAPK